MLFVFVLGINQYYLPFLHNHAEEKRQASQDTLIACEH